MRYFEIRNLNLLIFTFSLLMVEFTPEYKMSTQGLYKEAFQESKLMLLFLSNKSDFGTTLFKSEECDWLLPQKHRFIYTHKE